MVDVTDTVNRSLLSLQYSLVAERICFRLLAEITHTYAQTRETRDNL